jgi:hypothetical protein
LGVSIGKSEDRQDTVFKSLSRRAEKRNKQDEVKRRLRAFFVVEDILGHLLFVTWSLEEARQLAANLVLSGKLARNLIAIRRIPKSMAQPPSTESGERARQFSPLHREMRITNSGSTSGLTLGYYVERHYNLSKLDLRTVRRIRIGNHLATLGSSKKALDILGLEAPRRVVEQVIALWHPVSEVADGRESSDLLGTRILNCDRRLLSLRYGIR